MNCALGLDCSPVSLMPSSDPFYAGLGQALRLGTEMLAALAVGGGLGWLIDSYVLPTEPWGLVVGLILGMAAGIRNSYRTAQHWSNADHSSEE